MDLNNRFTNSLMGIYNLDIIKYFISFLEGEQAVLFSIYKNKETQPSVISNKLNITKARMSSIIKSLKQKDMLETYKDDLDKRKMKLILKPKGESFIKEKEDEILNLFKYFHYKMGDKDILELTILLEKIVSIMKDVEK